MTLATFFDAVGPFLRGETGVDSFRSLDPSPSTNADLLLYPWLVSFDQCRIMGELMPRVRQWVELLGRDWDELVAAYIAEHPPGGHSVPHVGVHFADWLAAHRETLDLPEGIEAVADFTWTAFLARTAPDRGPDLDRRVFLRHYEHDPRIANQALDRGEQPTTAGPCTLVVFRDEPSGTAKACTATLATMAALLDHHGTALTGALAIGPRALATERNRLENRGILPQHAPPRAGDTP